jgi:hypothetical protein
MGASKMVIEAWDGAILKDLPILKLLDDYNHYMNGVDLAD